MYDSVHKQVSLSEWVNQATYKQNDGRLLYPQVEATFSQCE